MVRNISKKNLSILDDCLYKQNKQNKSKHPLSIFHGYSVPTLQQLYVVDDLVLVVVKIGHACHDKSW